MCFGGEGFVNLNTWAWECEKTIDNAHGGDDGVLTMVFSGTRLISGGSDKLIKV